MSGRRDAWSTVETHPLIDNQIADRLELVRTAALDAQINQMNGPLRARCTTRIQHITSPRTDPDPARLRQIRDELTTAARTIDPGYPGSAQDRFDLDHVTEAVAIGVHVFVTRDGGETCEDQELPLGWRCSPPLTIGGLDRPVRGGRRCQPGQQFRSLALVSAALAVHRD